VTITPAINAKQIINQQLQVLVLSIGHTVVIADFAFGLLLKSPRQNKNHPIIKKITRKFQS
jgi:hypothetical protein